MNESVAVLYDLLAQSGAAPPLRLAALNFSTSDAGGVHDVDVGEKVTIRVSPKGDFKPLRILIDATVSPDFLITDIRIDEVSQFANEHPFLCPYHSMPSWPMKLCPKDRHIEVDVWNRGGAPRAFFMTLLGELSE